MNEGAKEVRPHKHEAVMLKARIYLPEFQDVNNILGRPINSLSSIRPFRPIKDIIGTLLEHAAGIS
jgi:hypothetical protein